VRRIDRKVVFGPFRACPCREHAAGKFGLAAQHLVLQMPAMGFEKRAVPAIGAQQFLRIEG
jgi:hypothetical protein